MRLRDIMTAPVETAKPDDAAEDAWRRMVAGRFHHLVVMDGRRPVGVVSERDLGGRSGTALRRDRTVEELMTTGIVAASGDVTVRKAANLMRGRGIGCLVVTAGNRIAGIVTTSDLLELLGRGAQRPVVSGVRWTMRARGPRRASQAR
jgi:acetoin utilization protein AcuB